MRAGAWGAAALAVVLMAGCGAPDPGDKVVATVMGDKITVEQVDAELRAARGAQPDDPILRRAALETIVARKLQAKAARAEGLDRRPQVLRAKALADEAFDANLFKLATLGSVPKPAAADIKAYVAAHPERFAERKVYLLEELRTPAPTSKALIDALMPTKSLAAAEAVLKAQGATYRRVPDSFDSLKANPKLSAAIAGLPQGEPFLLPAEEGLIIGVVRDMRAAPLVGAEAETFAAQMLLAERQAMAAVASMAALRKDTVTYADGYGPKPAGK